jgi:hypothetical protein
MIDLCIHGAIVLHKIIRDKDKDPSFSAKQARSADARVWAELGNVGSLAHWNVGLPPYLRHSSCGGE